MESRTCIDEFEDEQDIYDYIKESSDSDNIIICFEYEDSHQSYYCESRSKLLEIMNIESKLESNIRLNYSEYHLHGDILLTRKYPRKNQSYYDDNGHIILFKWNEKAKDKFINTLEDENSYFYKLKISETKYEDKNKQNPKHYIDYASYKAASNSEIIIKLFIINDIDYYYGDSILVE